MLNIELLFLLMFEEEGFGDVLKVGLLKSKEGGLLFFLVKMLLKLSFWKYLGISL